MGNGVYQDYSTAEKWLLKAAKQGEADAQQGLLLLHNLRVVENDNIVLSASFVISGN
tara:strand:- start:421 stop:591 length:171 start_codon:yes stop_codon:yes gene_type:complete